MYIQCAVLYVRYISPWTGDKPGDLLAIGRRQPANKDRDQQNQVDFVIIYRGQDAV